jgi:hypothetical protein
MFLHDVVTKVVLPALTEPTEVGFANGASSSATLWSTLSIRKKALTLRTHWRRRIDDRKAELVAKRGMMKAAG